MVVPTYNVATYLPDFLTSLDDQSAGLDGVEVVFVDDGATDESAAIIEDWLGRRAGVAARLVRKENGGLSSARNAGLEVATGEWICFADPDDMLSKNYLGVVKGFLASAKARTVHLVVTKLVYYDEPGGTLTDRHPLRGRFAQGTRVIDMTREPHFVHVGANHAFFRRTVLVENGLRYDPTVVPVWEDGKVTAQYLSRFARPLRSGRACWRWSRRVLELRHAAATAGP